MIEKSAGQTLLENAYKLSTPADNELSLSRLERDPVEALQHAVRRQDNEVQQ